MANNYSPISVLPVVSKIVEKIINKRLIAYLNKLNSLSDSHYGFLQGRSTEDAILKLTTTITNYLDKGKISRRISKLKKGIRHHLCPHSCTQTKKIGIIRQLLKLLSDYLHGRTQQVRLDKCVSEEADITYGVPQESVLGPTLFFTYIYGLTNLPIEHEHALSYANNTIT